MIKSPWFFRDFGPCPTGLNAFRSVTAEYIREEAYCRKGQFTSWKPGSERERERERERDRKKPGVPVSLPS
jgi:hypothetical protein